MVVIAVVVAIAWFANVGARPASIEPSGTPIGVGVGLQPRVAQRPTGGDAALIASIPKIRLARVLIDSPAYGSAGGVALVEGNGDPLTIQTGMQLAVFEGPVSVGADVWFRVYLLPNANVGPTEYFAWLPLHDAHRAETIAFMDPPVCPDGNGISVLASLDPFTRAGCLGAASFTERGWTGSRILPTWYRIRRRGSGIRTDQSTRRSR